MEGKFRFPVRTAVIAVAAALFVPLVADWVAPGAGTRCACLVLRASCGGGTPPPHGVGFSLWGWLVGLIGWDVGRLGIVSMAGGLVSVGLVAGIAADVFAMAVRRGKQKGEQGAGEYAGVESAAAALTGLALALTPGFLRAATRIGPLTVALAMLLAAFAYVTHLVLRGGDAANVIGRFRRNWALMLAALLLAGLGVWELVAARLILRGVGGAGGFVREMVVPLTPFLAVGVLAVVAIAGCVRRRWIADRRVQGWCFAAWGAAVAAMGAVAVGSLGQGRAANRVVAAILANAQEAGRVAVVSDGELDELFAFMAPAGERVITLAREWEPAYGRELAAWVRGRDEDLAFAAELGPRALIDEWMKIDKAGFEATVATAANYFPTREKWDEARAIVAGMSADEPTAKYLTRLMGRTGNALGCRMIERGDLAGAWAMFKEIVESVDRENYTALLNLSGMCERGCRVSKGEADEIARKCRERAKSYGTPERILAAVRSGGRLYVDPETAARQEAARIARERSRELTNREKALMAALTEPPGSERACRIARETIESGVREGMVRVDRVAVQLINLDFGIGDWELAERDAIRVLRADRHNPTANAAMGAINGARGDYAAAERYLRRGMRGEERGRNAVALNDLAFTLARIGKGQEAVPLAREAVAAMPENWNFRETLAYALIRAGEIKAGEQELVRAEEDAVKAGRKTGEIVRFEIDRAWLFAAKGDKIRRNMSVRGLRGRQGLTESQRREVGEID